jgi:adenylate cyclase
MAEERVERRLIAILAADVAGYSRLMGVDEEGTHKQLKALRSELVDPQIGQHRGRIIKNTGDGLLAEFVSVVDGARCAFEIQRGMAERNTFVAQDKRIDLRIGIHIGDVIIEPEDIFGDGVNIAARLEGIADPGGVCFSQSAYEQIKDKFDVVFVPGGDQHLKNIAQPIAVYRVQFGNTATTLSGLALPEKPSIAVLPFDNMSGDPGQEYFVDGMTEEIITGLSRIRWLFVIARNSSFTYKGHPVDVKQAGREMGVRYLLEGSVRKSANSIRITTQLIDATTGAHLWADRFDGELTNIFDLQDQVTASVVGALGPKLQQFEIERAKRKPTDNLDAYDCYLRALANVHYMDRSAMEEGLRYCYQAIELDPEFATAYAMAAWYHARSNVNGWTVDHQKNAAEAERLVKRATILANDDANVFSLSGIALAFAAFDVEGGADLVDQAITLNPNLAWGWNYSGWIRLHLGHWEIALKHIAHAMRLSPLDALKYNMQAGMAFANFLGGHFDEAATWVERALRAKPNYLPSIRIAVVNNVWRGQIEEAKRLMLTLRELDPKLRLSNLKARIPLRNPTDFARYEEGMRQAGLPN